jgi:nicotinamidase-related amidase
MKVPRVHRSELGILLIDVQPSFLEYAFPNQNTEHDAILVRLEHLLMLADWMDLPLIYTLEKPIETNGELPERLQTRLPAHGQGFVKNYFGSMTEPAIRTAVEKLPGRQIAVAGAETDVCVLQSTLGLLELGFEVFLLEDCLFTTEQEPAPALRRMYQAGAVPSTLKSLAYELAKCVDNVGWYAEIWAGRGDPYGKPRPKGFIPPEKWPAWKSKL